MPKNGRPAMQALLRVVEHDGPTMFVANRRHESLNRRIERVLTHRRHPASSPPLLTQFKAGQCDVADANCPMTVFALNWAAHLGGANSR
jgi:hypothetical protein